MLVTIRQFGVVVMALGSSTEFLQISPSKG